MNSVILIGRITNEIVLKHTSKETTYVSFTLAVDRKFKTSSGEKQTDFINCIAWEKTAELIGNYCSKGHKLAVQGSIQTRTYDDQNGQKHYITEVLVSGITFLENKQSGQAQQNNGYQQPSVSPNSFNQPKQPVKQQVEFDDLFETISFNNGTDDLPF